MRKVVKLNQYTMDLIDTYDSMRKAAIENKTSVQQIYNVCNLYLGVCKTAGGFVFMYLEDFFSTPDEEIKEKYTKKCNIRK